MNINEIIDRNARLLEKMIRKFRIEYTVEQLLEFNTVYMLVEYKYARIRLMCNRKVEDKTELKQLYSIGKKRFQQLEEDGKLMMYFQTQLNLFIQLIQELKSIRELESKEQAIEFVYASAIKDLENEREYKPHEIA